MDVHGIMLPLSIVFLDAASGEAAGLVTFDDQREKSIRRRYSAGPGSKNGLCMGRQTPVPARAAALPSPPNLV
jgi:hypothetical protein